MRGAYQKRGVKYKLKASKFSLAIEWVKLAYQQNDGGLLYPSNRGYIYRNVSKVRSGPFRTADGTAKM